MSTQLLIENICDAIRTTLKEATEVDYGHSYDELKEGMPDVKTLQVYPESGEGDITTNTGQTTFQGGIQHYEYEIIADYYASARKDIGEDMAALVPGISSIIAKIQAQKTKPYFGLAGIESFRWRFERVVFQYGAETERYVGARFYLTIRTF